MILDQIKALATAMKPTGSRVICNPPPMDTDEDYIVLVAARRMNDVLDLLGANDFQIGGSELPEEFLGSDEQKFKSFKHGDLNFIVTSDLEFYRRFVAATAVAKRFNLLDKSDRIVLFHAVIFGVTP